MKSSKNIFITGATGSLGSNILKEILTLSNSHVYLLIRGKNNSDVRNRGIELIKKILKEKFNNKILKRTNFIKGDIVEKNLGIDSDDFKKISGRIDEIYHCAATTGFRIPLSEARKVNVEGTENVLKFVRYCNKTTRINYISTTFIIGSRNSVLTENDLKIGQQFNNTYEQSKFEAECLVSDCSNNGMNIMVFRPSIIVGAYNTGEIFKFKLLYEALHFISLELFREFPADLHVEHNLIPVDLAAKAIYVLATEEERGTYHIIGPNNISCFHFMEEAADFFGYNNPKWVSLNKFDINQLSPIQKRLMSPFIPYFNYKGKYEAKTTVPILRKYNVRLPKIDDDFLKRIFKYCVKIGYIKLKK